MNTSFFAFPIVLKKHTCHPFLIAVAFALILAPAPQAQSLNDSEWEQLPVLERIQAAPVFQNRITFVGDFIPDPLETRDLWAAIDVMRRNGPKIGVQALELFAETYTNSVWLPSLQANLGLYYRNIGRYSLALNHWEAAWESTRHAESGATKDISDFVLAHYTRLLASLGRLETLGEIFTETRDRFLDGGPLFQTFDATREGYRTMLWRPDVAYRCGSLALRNVARLIQPENADLEVLFTVPSPQSGFSLTSLKAMADFYHLNLVPVYRAAGGDVIVPSLVHWKVEHYAAITERQGDKYKVEDPTFEGAVWMDAETINAEASGFFLIPFAQKGANWISLTKEETDAVLGRGYPHVTDPTVPENCPRKDDGNGSSDQSNPATEANPGNPGETCPTCNQSGGPEDADCSPCQGDSHGTSFGMPVWKIVEPYIDLWLIDTPLFYTKSQGERQEVVMTYKQRNTRPHADMFSFGPSWECNLLSYFWGDPSGNLDLWAPGGGKSKPPTNGLPEFKMGSISSTTTSGSGEVTSVSSTFPTATIIRYSDLKTNVDGSRYIFPTHQIDRYGRTNKFNYSLSGGKVHLDSVTDYDGRSLTLSYTNTTYSHQITQIADPYGKTVKFKYDSSGRLTNITDAAGISTGFGYDTNTGWITNMVTLYGTTSFKLTGTSTNFQDDPSDPINRSALVTEPNGGKQLFIYSFNRSDLEILQWAYEEVPTLPEGIELPNPSIWNVNNSFFWNRQQYAALNSTFRSSENFNDLTADDYILPRRRHWLVDHDIGILSGTLDSQRNPSPDGTTLGQSIWYDYPGKGYYPYSLGTNSRPSTISYVLPNGQTYYEYYQYNKYFNPTLKVTSYGDGSTSRTNWYVYHTGDLDLAYVIGPTGDLVAGYGYNTNHQVTSFTNAAYEVTKYTYNTNTARSILQRVSPSGLTNIYSYGGDGFVSQVVQKPINSTNTFTYNNSFVRTHTSPLDMTLTNYWDNLQRLTGVAYPTNVTVSNIYTALDLTASKDQLGNWTYSGFNSIRQKVAETNANGVITRLGYCDCGSLMYVTNAFGTALQEVTSYGYDYQGNRTYVALPDGSSTTNWFDSLKRRVATADSIGTRWFGYNNQGLLVGITNSVGLERWVVYDIEDHVYSTTDANGVTVTNTYDNLGRPLTRGYPDGGTDSVGYTANVSRISRYTNQLGKVWQYAYDTAGRKISEVAVGMYTNTFTYDAAGDLKTLTDGKNQTTTWNYDRYGRVTNKLDQAGVEILRYQYDANSRLTNRWSKAKTNTVYSYDAVGNLTNINYPVTTDVVLSYDALNRLTNMTDTAGTTKFTYYAGGLPNTEDGPTLSSDVVTYTYTNRLIKNLSVQQSTGSWTNGFTYDAAKRLSTVASPAGSFSYSYQANGALVKKLGLPNTSYITNTFDSVGRMTSTKLNNSSHTTLDKMDYLYNSGNQRIKTTRTDASYYTNSYDNIGQLVWADSTVAAEDRGYIYDAAWNLTKRTNNVTPQTFAVDNKNQLTSGPVGADAYDDNGNLISQVYDVSGPMSYKYTYDDENRLATMATDTNYTATGSRWKSDFTYDGLGRLRKRIDSTWTAMGGGSWNPGTTTYYIYSGMRVIQERSSSSVPTVSYTRGSDLSGSFEGAGGVGGLLSRSHAYQSGSGSFTNHNYYHGDGNGNITYLVNTNQTVAASYRYDPFGRTISSSGTLSVANTYRFSSKEIHPNSGIYYYGYRFYDPNLQRWLNRDPIQEWGGINLYEFVRNNPISYVDRNGLDVYITIVGGPSNIPHMYVVGDDGNGGSYTLDFYPAKDGERLHGPGKYEYRHYPSLKPCDLAFKLRGRLPTTPATDRAMNDLAKGLDGPSPVDYSLFGHNCWDAAFCFQSTAANYQNFGSPFPPINTKRNLPPIIVFP